MLRLFFLFFLIPLCAKAYAQTNTVNNCAESCECQINGYVFDAETKQPLPFASVKVKETSLGAITDEKGYFQIQNICYSEFDIQVTYIGYQSVSHHHDLLHPEPKIYLSANEEHLRSVVVEGKVQVSNQLSTAEELIDEHEIRKRSGQSIGEVLTTVPGLALLKTGQNINKPILHGLYGSRLPLFIDGIRHESQSWGQEHAPEIDPGQFERIAVIKGATSIKYGPGAIGGVIAVESRQPQLHDSLTGNFSLQLQHNGLGGNLRGQLSKGYERWAWVATATARRLGDQEAPDYMLTNTGVAEQGFSYKALIHPAEHLNLWFQYNYLSQDLGILRGSVVGSPRDYQAAIDRPVPEGTQPFSYTISNPRQQTGHHLFSTKAQYIIEDHILNLQYGFQFNKRQEYDVRRGSLAQKPIIDLELLAHQAELSWEMPRRSKGSGIVGVQSFYQRTANQEGTESLFFVPNFRTTSLGLYAQQIWEYTNYNLDAGLRLDYLDAFTIGYDNANAKYSDEFSYTSLSGSVGYSRNLGINSQWKSQLGTAWRPPNVAELYSFGKHGVVLEYGLRRFLDGSTGVFTGEDFSTPPEINFSWTNTFNLNKQEKGLEMTAYANYIINYLLAQPGGLNRVSSGLYPYYVYRQTNALLAGLDFSYILKHKDWLHSQFKGAFLFAQDVEKQSPFVGMPPPNLSYSLQFSGLANKPQHFDAALELDYTFKSFYTVPVVPFSAFTTQEGELLAEENLPPAVANGELFDFTDAPDDFLLVNLSTTLERKRASYRLAVNNLLNTRYRLYTNRLRYFADEAGRNISFMITYKF